VTAAALVFVVAVPVFGLASVLAERAVAVVSALALIFFERVLAAAPVVFIVAAAVFGLASVLAERDVAVVSGLALTGVEHALVAVAVFVLAAFLADRAFALPARRPLC
jgi:hypothetical protein